METKINKQLQKKTNPELVKTILACKNKEKWGEIGKILSGSVKKRFCLNLEEINNLFKEDEQIVIPGKVLSQGALNRKIKIIALGFSEKAREKLLKSGNKISSIYAEIKANPEAKGLKILK